MGVLTPKQELHKNSGEALEYWSKSITDALSGKFGQGRIGHILILFDFGQHGRTFQWMSDAKRASVIELLRTLATHIEKTDSRIMTLH